MGRTVLHPDCRHTCFPLKDYYHIYRLLCFPEKVRSRTPHRIHRRLYSPPGIPRPETGAHHRLRSGFCRTGWPCVSVHNPVRCSAVVFRHRSPCQSLFVLFPVYHICSRIIFNFHRNRTCLKCYKNQFNYSTFALMRKGTAAEKSAFVPVFSIVFERTERYFCGILQLPSRDGGSYLLLS